MNHENEFENIKQQLPLKDYASSKLQRAKAGNKFVCPICNSGGHGNRNSDSAFSLKGEKWHCFSCGNHGDIFDLIAICEQLDPNDRKAHLNAAKNFLGVNTQTQAKTPLKTHSRALQTQKQQTQQSQISNITKGREWNKKFIANAQAEFKAAIASNDPKFSTLKAYANKRGYSMEQLALLGAGYDKQTSRLVMPYKGSNCYHIDRAINDIEPKYLKPPSETVNKNYKPAGNEPLYNTPALSTEKAVFVVEGVFDAYALEIEGFNNVVALAGTGESRLLTALKQTLNKPTLLLMLDNDKAGKDATERLTKQLESLNISYFEVDASAIKGKDADEKRLNDKTALKGVLSDYQNSGVIDFDQRKEKADTEFLKRAFIVDNEQMLVDILTGRISSEPIKTGIKPFDNFTGGFYPNNLIVLGAVSSLGKTSLINQIACYIAKTRPVLFVTIEEPACAMFAQIYARLSYELNRHNPIGKAAILNAKERTHAQQTALENAMNTFYPISKNLRFMKATHQPSTQDIETAAKAFASVTGKEPVIFIDYLQLLKPPNEKDTDKQANDKNISALKRLAGELNTPIVANSSLNRESYETILAMNAFKETGGIEYGADMVLTLQVAGLTKDMKKNEIRDKIDACKEQKIRELNLNILKNRHGQIKKEGFNLTFNSVYNLFTFTGKYNNEPKAQEIDYLPY